MTNNIIIILIEIKNEGMRWMTCMAMFHGLPIIMGFLLHFIENLLFFFLLLFSVDQQALISCLMLICFNRNTYLLDQYD